MIQPGLANHKAKADRPTMDFARAVARGLSENPKRLDSRYLYDTEGSRLFEDICRQPEYYLTRAEAAILQESADDIAASTGPVALIEFGSGSSTKTRFILDAYARRFGQVSYTPVDISESILRQAERDLAAKHPLVRVKPFHGNYDEAFAIFRSLSPVMFLFLGSTVGNFDHLESARFWTNVSSHLQGGDFCLLGVDITEDPQALHAAYNDAAGVTAAFTKNLFERMNRELGSSIDVGAVNHVAGYNPEVRRVEIFARFAGAQAIDVAPLGRRFNIEAGEMVQTEISRKFRLDEKVPYLQAFSLRTERIYTDSAGRFAVLLLKK